jgi:hypothetical protein
MGSVGQWAEWLPVALLGGVCITTPSVLVALQRHPGPGSLRCKKKWSVRRRVNSSKRNIHGVEMLSDQ